MSQEELYKRQSEIKEQIREANKQLMLINQQIIEKYPFKPGDKICAKVRTSPFGDNVVEKEAWIVNVQLNDYGDYYVTLTVNYPRKDGSRSERQNYIHGIHSDDIKIIEKR